MRGPSILATAEGEFILEGLEWAPSCGLSEDEQCKSIFCDGQQAYLQDTLCGDNPEDCKLVVVCDPKSTRRANRALQTTTGDRKFTFSISLLIECFSTPDCSDTAAEKAEAQAAYNEQKFSFQGGITQEQIIAGIKAAIAQLNPPNPAGDFYSTFTFAVDPDTAELDEPAIVTVPNDVTGSYEFVGEGGCRDSTGTSYGYILPPKGTPITLAECANWASAATASDCWVQSQAFVGFEYGADYSNQCYVLFDLGGDVGRPRPVPSDTCELPADSDCDHPGEGTGPIVSSYGPLYGGLCYKYVG